MEQAYENGGTPEHGTEPVPSPEENRINAMIMAAIGTTMAGVSYIQCCIPVSVIGFIFSYLGYRKSVESGNDLARKIAIVGMALAVIQILLVVLIIMLYVAVFVFALASSPGSYSSRGY